jgi:protocatechuate 3,4-dioxygenase beta subunit
MRYLAACLLVVFVAVALYGQTMTSLTGTVTDPSGAVVPGATVTLVNDDTAAQREDRSDSQGRYSFVQVQPGHYLWPQKRPGSPT